MKWFKCKPKAQLITEKEWRLQMFKRRGYILNRYSIKEGK